MSIILISHVGKVHPLVSAHFAALGWSMGCKVSSAWEVNFSHVGHREDNRPSPGQASV